MATDNTVVQPFAGGETQYFENVMQALAAAAPEGSSVAAVGFDRVDTFLRAGYRVVDDHADVAIARGGEREFLAARHLACKRIIFAPTHAYFAAACHAFRAEDKMFAVMKRGAPPFGVVIDEKDTDNNLASLFGEIVSLDLAAFDAAFGASMRGERTDGAACTAVARLITELTAELKPLEKNRTAQKRALAKAGGRAAQLVAEHPALLHASGAAQAAEAHRMLCKAEDRPLGMRGETEMLLCAYVTDFYIKNLSNQTPEFPPDNNKRIDSLCEYLGADPVRACVYTSPIFAPKKLKLYEYRMREFKSDWLRRLTEISKRRIAAWPVFKRLYPDDGYCIKSLVDKTDVGLCLALAPDVFAADTLLSFLKQSGKLEKYIV